MGKELWRTVGEMDQRRKKIWTKYKNGKNVRKYENSVKKIKKRYGIVLNIGGKWGN